MIYPVDSIIHPSNNRGLYSMLPIICPLTETLLHVYFSFTPEVDHRGKLLHDVSKKIDTFEPVR